MTKEYTISSVSDFAALEPEQRKRCAIDLLAWADFADKMKPLIDEGIMDPLDTMIWVDDDRIGEVSGVSLYDRASGEELCRVNMPEPKP